MTASNVSPDAKIGANVEIGPYACIAAGAVIGDGCRIGPHAIIWGSARLSSGVSVDAHAVIGGDPQDIKFDPSTPSFVEVGEGTRIREGVTIHRSTKAQGITRIGKECYLMAQSHVGHDSQIGDRTILANLVMTAGHVAIGSDCFVGGGAALHQNIRIGDGAMIGGAAGVSYDVPPFCVVAERNELHGLNLIGIKRRGADQVIISDLKALYRFIFWETGNVRRKAEAAQAAGLGTTELGRRFLDFLLQPSKKGYVERPRITHQKEES